jgi:hypothetical protein
MTRLVQEYSHSSSRSSLQMMEEGASYCDGDRRTTELSVPTGTVLQASSVSKRSSATAVTWNSRALSTVTKNSQQSVSMLRHVIAEEDHDEELVLETKQLKKQLRQVTLDPA